MENFLDLESIFPVKPDGEKEKDPEIYYEAEGQEIPQLTQDEEVATSYILTNALFNLLVNKGIITPEEIHPLILELHQIYRRTKE